MGSRSTTIVDGPSEESERIRMEGEKEIAQIQKQQQHEHDQSVLQQKEIERDTIRIQEEAEIAKEEERTKQSQFEYEKAQTLLQSEIVEETSGIIKKQLELCQNIVTLEIERAQLKSQALLTAREFIPIDPQEACLLMKNARAIENPKTAEEVLILFKEHLSISDQKFNMILEAGVNAGLITQEEIASVA
eukprot:TRINITY_DN1829_c0_g1_i3.p1 TRINITY_DN1829_c0_g1~~TRINITY_DN1829_c0_g1_i3.p1  ORF type:complete len:190 (-),score=42.40 TRINITY_DN1829_c0_g1_i3:246-815(-)